MKVSRGDESFNLPVIDEKLPDPKSIPLRKRKANDENVEKKVVVFAPLHHGEGVICKPYVLTTAFM